MPQSLQLQSPAKLNLMLHITSQRDDGYHNLQTVFQFIDLNDTITFNKTDSNVRRISGNEQVTEQGDLIIKAAKLLQQHCSTSQGVDISIQKNIPIGGGLGGGSSNAATTLMALNYLWDLQLNSTELQQIGLQLGADIPIFIFGQNSWAEGVGEDLKAIKLPKSWFLIIHPQVFVSTGQIFSSKHSTEACPSGMSRFLLIVFANWGFAFPVNTIMSCATIPTIRFLH